MAYSLEEQETFLHYDALEKVWRVETNIWHHIQRYKPMLVPETIVEEIEDGRVVGLKGVVDEERFKVKVSKKREYTEEQRAAMRERMAGMRQKEV